MTSPSAQAPGPHATFIAAYAVLSAGLLLGTLLGAYGVAWAPFAMALVSWFAGGVASIAVSESVGKTRSRALCIGLIVIAAAAMAANGSVLETAPKEPGEAALAAAWALGSGVVAALVAWRLAVRADRHERQP